jgi:uncharacterized protein DUF4169
LRFSECKPNAALGEQLAGDACLGREGFEAFPERYLEPYPPLKRFGFTHTPFVGCDLEVETERRPNSRGDSTLRRRELDPHEDIELPGRSAGLVVQPELPRCDTNGLGRRRRRSVVLHALAAGLQRARGRLAFGSRTMGNVVNLNKYRKRKAKADAAKRAETNRRLHGRTKAERAREELQKKRLESKLDGARLEREPGDDSDSSA